MPQNVGDVEEEMEDDEDGADEGSEEAQPPHPVEADGEAHHFFRYVLQAEEPEEPGKDSPDKAMLETMLEGPDAVARAKKVRGAGMAREVLARIFGGARNGLGADK